MGRMLGMVEQIDTGLPQPANEAQWLKARLAGIGASEASAVIGCNPYMSNQDLWRIKTGRKAAEDISNKACVHYGHQAEAPLRELFALDYPQYAVQYGGSFDLVRSRDFPWLFATLDGRLLERATGRRGVYEGKTTEILRSMQMEKWVYTGEDGRRHGRVPDNYYAQICHQLLATGWDFVVLNCQFKRDYGRGDCRTETRRYFFERAALQADLDFLLQAERRFWRCVETDTMPALILPDI